jgi:hypothetical protein
MWDTVVVWLSTRFWYPTRLAPNLVAVIGNMESKAEGDRNPAGAGNLLCDFAHLESKTILVA